jgi:hypothetical protein
MVGGIDQVIDRLQAMVQQSIRDGDRSGYFAALYRRVTETIRDAIRGASSTMAPAWKRSISRSRSATASAAFALTNRATITTCDFSRHVFGLSRAGKDRGFQHLQSDQA